MEQVSPSKALKTFESSSGSKNNDTLLRKNGSCCELSKLIRCLVHHGPIVKLWLMIFSPLLFSATKRIFHGRSFAARALKYHYFLFSFKNFDKKN